MTMMKRSHAATRIVPRRGQTIVEAALLLAIVAVALAALFSFIRASVSFRLKNGADAFGHGLLFPRGGPAD